MIEKLLEKYPDINPLYHNRTFKYAMTNGITKSGNVRDVWIAFEMNNKKNIIMSIGDFPKLIEDLYRQILKETGWTVADILVCCAHEGKRFDNFFQRLCGENITVVSKNKGTYDDESVAQELFGILDNEIWQKENGI